MKNLKMLRGRKGLTQKSLAKEIGITRASVIGLERDSCRSTSKKTTDILCEFFEITPCELYGIDNFRYLPQSIHDCEYLIGILEDLKNEFEKRDKSN